MPLGTTSTLADYIETLVEMVIGIFTDKNHQPTNDEILVSIGSKKSLWERLIESLTSNYTVQRDLRFYGKNYGWAVRFRRGGKALLSMYPGKDSFSVQIVIGPTDAEKVADLDLGESVRKVLEKAHQFPEGRWLFIKVESEKDLNDIQQLLLVKSRPSKKV